MKYRIGKDLQNSFRSHNELCKLADILLHSSASGITIDLSNVNFIASNLFSVLGCIFYEYKAKSPSELPLRLSGVKPAIKDTIQKNGFGVHFGLEKIPDVHNTVIPYKIFSVSEIDEYERYLTLNLFTRQDLPLMSQDASDSIRDSLLELFNNVTDHTSSDSVFTCGQYFPKSYMLFFTIVDIGETISHNVTKFHNDLNLTPPDSALEWAIETGNTTSVSNSPRGIGLSLIRDFVHLNKGTFYIVSDTETFELHKGKERFRTLDYPFPGTIVTIGFNLHDSAVYFLSSDEDNIIQF
jgi:anti-anti-sigma regulatory factor